MKDKIDIRELHKSRPSLPRVNANLSSKGIGESEKGGFWDFLNRDIRLAGSGLPDKIKETFYLELSTLLAAGIDIRGSLELIKEEQSKKSHQEVFGAILQRIIAGSTLSSALKQGSLFTPYEYFSVQIGEETGKLVSVLKELATFFKIKIDQRRQIIGALTYPSLVLVVAGLAVSFMMSYVVPMFADVLKRFGGDLPAITKMVLRISQFFRAYGLDLLLIVACIVFFVISQRKKQWFRKGISAIIVRTPVIGDIILKIHLARFSNTMSLLIGSRIPLLQAIQLVKQMVTFFPIEISLGKVEADVLSGIPFHQSLSYHVVYPKKMISLIKVGEEVNQLDLFFSKIASQYAGEVEYRTTLLSKFIEPLIIVVLGLVVGVILIAMYLPLFKLGQTF